MDFQLIKLDYNFTLNWVIISQNNLTSDEFISNLLGILPTYVKPLHSGVQSSLVESLVQTCVCYRADNTSLLYPHSCKRLALIVSLIWNILEREFWGLSQVNTSKSIRAIGYSFLIVLYVRLVSKRQIKFSHMCKFNHFLNHVQIYLYLYVYTKHIYYETT